LKAIETIFKELNYQRLKLQIKLKQGY